MEDDPLVAGTGEGGDTGSSNNGVSELNEQLNTANRFNIATMSDFQFSESLDALIDIPYSNSLTPPPPPPALPSDLSMNGVESSGNVSQPQVLASGTSAVEPSLPRGEPSSIFQSTAASPFVMSLPTGFNQNSFIASTNFVPFVTQQYTLQNTLPVDAFGQPLGSNQNTFQPGMAYFPFPSIAVTSHTAPIVASSASIDSSRKRGLASSNFPISEDESDLRKRKADRNAREQQRAQQVTDQISHLRELLERSGINLSKGDKFSTLLAVEDYIRDLQTKSAELTSEHEKLLSTLQQTSELVNSHYIVTPLPSSSAAVSGSEESKTQDSSDQDEESESDASVVKGINYKWVFDCCPFAIGIASIDGRFLDCNKEFEEITGYSRSELLPLEQGEYLDVTPKVDGTSSDPPIAKKKRNMSIFNVLHRECIERLFCAMSKTIQKCNDDDEEDVVDKSDDSNCSDTVTQEVKLCKRTNRKVCFVMLFTFLISLLLHFRRCDTNS
jgi:PAS domain-containing protein